MTASSATIALNEAEAGSTLAVMKPAEGILIGVDLAGDLPHRGADSSRLLAATVTSISLNLDRSATGPVVGDVHLVDPALDPAPDPLVAVVEIHHRAARPPHLGVLGVQVAHFLAQLHHALDEHTNEDLPVGPGRLPGAAAVLYQGQGRHMHIDPRGIMDRGVDHVVMRQRHAIITPKPETPHV